MTLNRDLRFLPKAHLHTHLEGAMRPETLAELCERYRIARPVDTRGKIFDNFCGFNQVYWAACHCIRTQEAWRDSSLRWRGCRIVRGLVDRTRVRR